MRCPGCGRPGATISPARPDVTGAELFDYVVGVARAEGFEWGSHIAGHLVGEFPAQEDRG